MAVQLDRGQARGRPGSTRVRYRPMAEINVTPFVDVMLVLLVIFMVTAPLLTVGVPVDLPETAAKPIAEPDEPLVITVDKSGQVYIQESKIELDTLVEKLKAITANKPDTRIYIRGDKDLAYGVVMQVMSTTTAAGFTKVALITDSATAAAGGSKAKDKKK